MMYGRFAGVYDELMDNIPYETWGRYLTDTLRAHGIRDGLVLDLCCGTGSMTEYLAGAGYDMIGIDSSEAMLEEALQKKDRSGHDILYLQQDMRSFELYGTVRAVVCVCDSLNYLLEEEELLQVFRLADNYLDPGGLFLFDMSSAEKYRKIGDRVIAENREDCTLIWENCWYEEEQINEYQITLFTRADDGRFDREQEIHIQRAYSRKTIEKCMLQAGLEVLPAESHMDKNRSEAWQDRYFFVGKERKKAENLTKSVNCI